MPYVNIKITNEGASSPQKAALISGVTDVLAGVLGKDPSTTFVVIDEVETEHWGIGGLPVEEYRRQQAATRRRVPCDPLWRSASNHHPWNRLASWTNGTGPRGRSGLWSSACPAATRTRSPTCTTGTRASSMGSRCGHSSIGRPLRTSPRRCSCLCGSIRSASSRGAARYAASSPRSPTAVRSTPSVGRRRAAVASRGWHERRAMCPTSPTRCSGRTRPARCARPSRCCPGAAAGTGARLFDGYTYRQVADVLGIPEGTAKSRLRMALTRIAEHLGPEMNERSERWT